MEQGYREADNSTPHRVFGAGTRRVAVFFEDLSSLLTVSRRLLREGYRGRSDVYIVDADGKTVWYLLLDVPDVTVYRLPRKFAFLAEYGREATEAGLAAYLAEYGRLICNGNGVNRLGRL